MYAISSRFMMKAFVFCAQAYAGAGKSVCFQLPPLLRRGQSFSTTTSFCATQGRGGGGRVQAVQGASVLGVRHCQAVHD